MMWKSRSFWRLYLPFAGLIIVLATTIGVVTSRWQQVELDKRLSQQLRGVVHVLREHVADKLQEDDLEGLQLTIRRLSAETKMRMTLIDAEGKVLADSHEDPQVMDNHLNRREFTLAKQDECYAQVSHAVCWYCD
jgi:two-component system phosphate regulon sensor histidine kinase PhoR